MKKIDQKKAGVSLTKPNVLHRDYMILLNLIWENKEKLPLFSLNKLQRFLPFSIQGLLQLKIEGKRLWDLFDTSMEQLLKESMRSIFEESFNKVQKFGKMNFFEINNKNIQIKQVISNLTPSSSLPEESEPSMSNLKLFQKDILTPLGVYINKLINDNLCYDDFLGLSTLIVKSQLLKGTQVELDMLKLVRSSDIAFQEIIQKFGEFQKSIMKLDISSLNVEDLKDSCFQKKALNSKNHEEPEPLVQKLIDLTVRNLKKTYYKSLSKCFKLNDVKLGIRSNLLWTYFNYEEGKEELVQFLEANNSIMIWGKRVSHIKKKLDESSKLPEAWILAHMEPSSLLISREDYLKAFKYKSTKINRFIKNHELYLEMAKLEGLSEEDSNSRECSFKEVMQDYISEKIPLCESRMKVVVRESFRAKVDMLLNSRLTVNDADFDIFLRKFKECALKKDDFDNKRIEELDKIKRLLDEILSADYLDGVESNSRSKELKKHVAELDKYNMRGKCSQKLNRLLNVISFVETTKAEIESQRVVEPTGDIEHFSKELDKIAAKDINWSKMSFLQNVNTLKNPDLKKFPAHYSLISSLYSKYMNYLIEGFIPGEKTNASALILVETISETLSKNPESSALYSKRKDNFVKLLQGIVELNQNANQTPTKKKYMSLNEFKTKVEDLYERRTQIKNIPTEKESKVRQAIYFLEQLEILARLLKRVKVFKCEDVNKRYLKMYRMISEVLKNKSIEALPIIQEEILGTECASFKKYFNEVNHILNWFEKLKSHVSDIHCSIEKNLQNSHFSHILKILFKLEETDSYERLLEKLSLYNYLEDEYMQLKVHLEEIKNLGMHLGDAKNYQKFTGSIEIYQNKETRQEFQIYLWYLANQRLKGIWFISADIKDDLRFLCTFNRLVKLLWDPVCLSDLQREYREALNSDMCNETAKKYLKDRRILARIEERIESAQSLKEQFSRDNRNTTPEDYFRLVDSIHKSSVKVFDYEMEEGSCLNKYQFIEFLKEVEAAFHKKNADSLLLRMEVSPNIIKDLFDEYKVPSKISYLVLKKYRDNQVVQDWLTTVLKTDKLYQIEIDLLLKELESDIENQGRKELLTKKHSEAQSLIQGLKKLETEFKQSSPPNYLLIEEITRKVEQVGLTLDKIQIESLITICFSVWVRVEAKEQIDIRILPAVVKAVKIIVVFVQQEKEQFVLSQIISRDNTIELDASSSYSSSETNLKKMMQILTPLVIGIRDLFAKVNEVISKIRREVDDEVMDEKEMEEMVKDLFSSLVPHEVNIDLRELFTGFEKVYRMFNDVETIPKLSEDFIDGKRIGERFEKHNFQEISKLLTSREATLTDNLNRIYFQVIRKEKFEPGIKSHKSASSKITKQGKGGNYKNGRRQSGAAMSKRFKNKKIQNNKAIHEKEKKFIPTSAGEKENILEETSEDLKSDPETVQGIHEKTPNQTGLNTKDVNKSGLEKRRPEVETRTSGRIREMKGSNSMNQLVPFSPSFPEKKICDKVSVTFSGNSSPVFKNISLITKMQNLDEEAIERLRLNKIGKINLEECLDDSSFDKYISLLKNEQSKQLKPLPSTIYGWLNFKNNSFSEQLNKSHRWKCDILQGKLWVFKSEKKNEHLKSMNVYPDGVNLKTNFHTVFIIDVKPLENEEEVAQPKEEKKITKIEDEVLESRARSKKIRSVRRSTGAMPS